MSGFLKVALFACLVSVLPAAARAVVFWQPGFPTVAGQPLAQAVLRQALLDLDPAFADLEALRDGAVLKGADLLVLPYGSAFPVEGWDCIRAYLDGGGDLLVLGGQALRVPVRRDKGFLPLAEQDTYARALDIRHTYELPPAPGARFQWRPGYAFLGPVQVRARRLFALEGDGRGLGFLVDGQGVEVAAPVVVKEHARADDPAQPMRGARLVLLDFEPEPGYWASADGLRLIRQSALYAAQGSTRLGLETRYAAFKPGEPPEVTLRYGNARRERLGLAGTGEACVELFEGDRRLQRLTVPVPTARLDLRFVLPAPPRPGFCTLRCTYREAGRVRECHQNGFWVEDPDLLRTGPVLGAKGDFLSLDGRPFLPVGANYFAADGTGWDFDAPRNGWTWERDFQEMEACDLTFVRTGTWTTAPAPRPTERFLRNLEGLLLSARRHRLVVNFTFFIFVPRTGPDPGEANPYLDPASRRAQAAFMQAIAARFKDAPNVCWDLINEPSFSNPRRLWTTAPNGDAAELGQWRDWLKGRYGSFEALASAWRARPEELGGGFQGVPLPSPEAFQRGRASTPEAVRAGDYLRFAQAAFSDWVRASVEAVRATGSRQLIDVGNDEGGVADRLLNPFYAGAGVAFTSNHTYWRDDALLWSSLACKLPGLPALIGETNYQPIHDPDGAWRYDERTGFANQERKLVLGFAGGCGGALLWDWDPECDFGSKRSDGSPKAVQAALRALGRFAKAAAPWATGFTPPPVAIVAPQTCQLSARMDLALAAQQMAVRAMYGYARGEASLVGEGQPGTWGSPRLLIVPAPTAFSREGLEALRARAEAGATVLITGPFDKDAQFHPTGLQRLLGLDYGTAFPMAREQTLRLPGGPAHVTFSGDRALFLEQAVLPGGETWCERPLGLGRVIFCTLPLELNDDPEAVAAAYRRAMAVAGVAPAYREAVEDPGLTICPARLPEATLYALVSESAERRVRFRDVRSGRMVQGELEPGRAALVLLGADGSVKAGYNWQKSGSWQEP